MIFLFPKVEICRQFLGGYILRVGKFHGDHSNRPNFGVVFCIRESLPQKKPKTSGLGITGKFDHRILGKELSFIPPRISTMHQQDEMTFFLWYMDLGSLEAFTCHRVASRYILRKQRLCYGLLSLLPSIIVP